MGFYLERDFVFHPTIIDIAVFGDAPGWMLKTGPNIYESVKTTIDAASAPGPSDDSTVDYRVGSLWIDIYADKAFVCVDASINSAIWKEITQQSTVNPVTSEFPLADNSLIRGDGGLRGVQDSGWLLSDSDVLAAGGNLNMGVNDVIGTRGYKVDLSGDGGEFITSNNDNQLSVYANNVESVRVDDYTSLGPDETSLWFYDANSGAMRQIMVGLPNTGGPGFKRLKIPN
jgi:hypothetical protein